MINKKGIVRPVLMGVSIGHYRITAGTAGCLVEGKDGNIYLLSNNHILANTNNGATGDRIVQPGPYDGGIEAVALLEGFIPIKFRDNSGCVLANGIAKLLNAMAYLFKRKTRFKVVSLEIPENEVDCAIAKPIMEISSEIVGIGKPKGVTEARVGDEVKKSGRTTCLTEGGVVIDDDASVDISYGGGRTARFIHQILISKDGFSAGGDSGSAILNKDNYIVGLLFAGSDKITIANHISTVEKLLGIKVRTI